MKRCLTAAGRIATLALAGTVAVAHPGCASSPDPRPAYAAPSLGAEQPAIVKTAMGYWIDEVDGARLPGPAPFTMSGNTVKVAPGSHAIGLRVPNGYYRFNYPFRAGHSYLFEGGGDISGVVKITDKTTGTSTTVGG